MYDFGNRDYKWQDIYIGGNFVNNNLFATKPSGGIFSQTRPGALIGGPSDFETLINNEKAIASTFDSKQQFIQGSLAPGDQILFEVIGNIKLEETDNLLEFGFFINDAFITSTLLTYKNVVLPFNDIFVTKVKLSVQINQTIIVYIITECDQISNRKLQFTDVDLSQTLDWDIRIKCTRPAKIQSQAVTVTKVF